MSFFNKISTRRTYTDIRLNTLLIIKGRPKQAGFNNTSVTLCNSEQG